MSPSATDPKTYKQAKMYYDFCVHPGTSTNANQAKEYFADLLKRAGGLPLLDDKWKAPDDG